MSKPQPPPTPKPKTFNEVRVEVHDALSFVDDMFKGILAEYGASQQREKQCLEQITLLSEEIKNLKLTTKPIKGVK